MRSRGGVEYERQANASAGQLQGNVAQQLQKYERGENRISTGRLQRAAEVLGVPVTFFFDGQATEQAGSPLDYLSTEAAVRRVRAFL